MAKKSRKTTSNRKPKSEPAYWPWPFWPLVPVTRKQVEAGVALAKARGLFWKETIDAAADHWEKVIPRN